MLQSSALVAALSALALGTRPMACSMVRATQAKWWNDLLAKNKTNWPRGRFNTAGGAEMLYLGDDYLTSAAETLVASVPTWIVVFATIQCDLQSVLDLTDPTVQAELRTNSTELAMNFRSFPRSAPATATQELGQAVAASGNFDGIHYASAARSGQRCLAVVLASLAGLGGTISVFDPKGGVFDTRP